MAHDLRTREEKIADEISTRISRDLSELSTSKIQVERFYTGSKNNGTHLHEPTDGYYFFADPSLRFVHIYTYDAKGQRIRKSSINVDVIHTIDYLTE